MPAVLFAVCYFGGIVLGAARWPLLAWGSYALSFYAHPPSRWWGSLLPDLRWALIAAIGVVLAAWRYKSLAPSGKILWFKDPIVVLLVAYIAWMWMQTPWAYGLEEHLKGVTIMTKYLLIVYVLIRILDSADAVDMVCITHIVGCAYFGVIAREMGIAGERLDGVGGPGVDDANTLGMMFGTAALMGVVQVMQGPMWKRGLVGLCLPFIMNGLVLTQSRSAFLGLAAGGVALYVLAPKKSRGFLTVLGAGGVALFLMVASQNFWERMDTIKAEGEERDFSAQTRLVLAQAQLRMFADHPLGTGHRGTAALSRQYLGEEYLAKEAGVAEENRARSSHNTFLTILVEQGIVGVVLYLSLLIVVAKRILKLRSAQDATPERQRVALLTASVGGALACIFVSGQFADYIRAEVLVWLYAMTVALHRMAADLGVQPVSIKPTVGVLRSAPPLVR